MANINFKKLLSSAYVIIVLLGLFVSGMTYYLGNSLTDNSNTLLERHIPLLNEVHYLNALAQKAEPILYEYYATTDRELFSKRYEANKKAIAIGLGVIQKEFTDSLQLEKLDTQFKKLNSLSNQLDIIISSSRVDWDRARTTLSEISLVARKIDSILDKLVTIISTEVTTTKQITADKITIMTRSVLFFIILISILVLFLIRSIFRRLGTDPSELEKAAQYLEQGNLHVNNDKNISGIYASINKTIKKLRDVISGIQTTSDQVSVAAEQISKGNMYLSNRTQSQASSLKEVVASMEQMTSAVKHNVDSTQQTKELTDTAKEHVNQGEMVVKQAITAMNGINNASTEISNIIDVIESIAFQTNLLALNAAVEAAHAGDQGRGFAVVASEVRNLAGLSAAAAKDIKELINNSVDKIQDGTLLVNDTGEALGKISTSIKKVDQLVGEITATSREQSDEIAQINKTIMQMDDMIQENAALVEEAASAAKSTSRQAEELNKLIAYFKLGDFARYNKNTSISSEQEHTIARPLIYAPAQNND